MPVDGEGPRVVAADRAPRCPLSGLMANHLIPSSLTLTTPPGDEGLPRAATTTSKVDQCAVSHSVPWVGRSAGVIPGTKWHDLAHPLW